MRIAITVEELVRLKFEGKINMSQEVVLNQEDAKKLGELLTKMESASFETK